MKKRSMSIGELARLGDCSVPTIRFYEAKGLLASAARHDNGRRVFETSDLERLLFIRSCRELEMPIVEIERLVSMLDVKGQPCAEAKDIINSQIVRLKKKIADLKRYEIALQATASKCGPECGPLPKDCSIFADFSTLQTVAQ